LFAGFVVSKKPAGPVPVLWPKTPRPEPLVVPASAGLAGRVEYVRLQSRPRALREGLHHRPGAGLSQLDEHRRA
jgi:hypothetical protein